jgi:hypothetical protein
MYQQIFAYAQLDGSKRPAGAITARSNMHLDKSVHRIANKVILPKTPKDWKEVGLDQEPVLALNQRLYNNKLVVKQVYNPTSFKVYHEDFKEHFDLNQIPNDEELDAWEHMVSHSNVVTCIEIFTDPELDMKFSLTEVTNGGSLWALIEAKRLDLSRDVPISYRKFVYDVMI